MIKLLKIYGLHHGLPIFILAWAAAILGSPDTKLAHHAINVALVTGIT